MRPLPALTIAACLLAPAGAAEDAETQRCIWSCLSGAGGSASSPAYSACVSRYCVAQRAPDPAPDPTKTWVTGRTGSGVGYAGIDGVRGQTGLYYFCGGGRGFLRVIGIDGGERGMIVEVDGQQFPLSFRPNGANQPESPQPASAPVIRALQSGNRVRVLSYEAGAIVDAPLTGSRRALAQVISGC